MWLAMGLYAGMEAVDVENYVTKVLFDKLAEGEKEKDLYDAA